MDKIRQLKKHVIENFEEAQVLARGAKSQDGYDKAIHKMEDALRDFSNKSSELAEAAYRRIRNASQRYQNAVQEAYNLKISDVNEFYVILQKENEEVAKAEQEAYDEIQDAITRATEEVEEASTETARAFQDVMNDLNKAVMNLLVLTS
jgi:uncharacterized protein YukE